MGRLAAELGMNQLIAIGAEAETTAAAAREAGLSDVLVCQSVDEVADQLAHNTKPGDLVLLKGSRTSRLEQVVDKWKNRPATET